MPCYYPLKGFVIGRDVVTGRKSVKVLSSLDASLDSSGFDSFPIPCGRCIGCRLDYAHEWANRCLLESKYHTESCFVTLTYDDFHVPRVVKNGEMFYSLSKRDFQLFIKRLRRRYPDKRIRFFGCGEYGDQTFRPHYHIILFGHMFDDLVPLESSRTGHPMWSSQQLYDLWSMSSRSELSSGVAPAGRCVVQESVYDACSYIARYVLKKQTGLDKDFYSSRGIEPPFLLMSRRPGIGRQFYDDHPDIFDSDFVHVSTFDGGKKFRPPKYFGRLLANTDLIAAEERSALSAALAQQAVANEELVTGMDHTQYLNRLAEVKSAEIKSLKRSAV